MKLILGAKYKKNELGKKFPATRDLPDEVYLWLIKLPQDRNDPIPMVSFIRESAAYNEFHTVFKEVFTTCYEFIEMPTIVLQKIIRIGKYNHDVFTLDFMVGLNRIGRLVGTETPDNELTHY